MLKGDGFLGTAGTLGADITLIVQIVFYIALCVGVIVQRKKLYKWHDWIQTPVVVLNLFFIFFIMVVSFRQEAIAGTLPQRPDDPHFYIPGLHALLGTLAEGLAIYCLLAGYKILPRKIGTLRYFMWTTFGLWTLAFAVGLGTYYRWYVVEAQAVTELPEIVEEVADIEAPLEPGEPPPPRRTLLQNFSFAPQELTVVVGTTLIWLNQDGAPHNVTFDDGSLASENFFQGETFELTFDTPGTFPIYCSLHGNPGGGGMAALVTVVERTEENVAAVAEEVAAQPEPLPMAPTPAPVAPPAPIALIEPPAAAAETAPVAGILSFRDHVGLSDSAVLSLAGVSPAGEGLELHAWLTSRDDQVLYIGPVKPDLSGKIFYVYRDPTRQNLMASFDGAQVSLEAQGASIVRPGEVLYSGRQAPAAYDEIRQIVSSAADTPDGRGYGAGARAQAEELIRHTAFVQLSFTAGSLADARRHVEHIINVLEGEAGQFYGDHDGAHGRQNPGDGFGLIPYIERMAETAAAAAGAEDATRAIQTHATHVEIAAGKALATAEAIREAALAILEANNVGDIGAEVETLQRLGQRLLLGEDEDGNGILALNEGGIFIAYQHAQYMGAVGILAGDAGAVADPAPIVDLEVSTQAAAGEIVIDMFDFDYTLESLTIPAGTKVRFVSAGQAKHSATADDDSFDTGLLGPGREAIVAFDEVGFFPFYCQLHGAPGGSGMAASITVIEPGAGEAEAEPVLPPVEAPAEETAAPEFGVEMADFSYSQTNLVIPLGANVTWFNTGAAQHSVTADDGSFDTGLYDSGGQATLTFDTPGTFPYYCQLHGAPGGGGMAGTITVLPEGFTPPAVEEPAAPEIDAPTPEGAREEVTVDMLDFVYGETSLVIPAGTTVTWLNKGEFKHSATADDGSFNTGLFDPGGEQAVTFDTPGTFPYYCELHGAPGGLGMAGVITVVDGAP